jgi:hypothetical protein
MDMYILLLLVLPLQVSADEELASPGIRQKGYPGEGRIIMLNSARRHSGS